jgi:hypothetical protein
LADSCQGFLAPSARGPVDALGFIQQGALMLLADQVKDVQGMQQHDLRRFSARGSGRRSPVAAPVVGPP